jgi:hypothetical protein
MPPNASRLKRVRRGAGSGGEGAYSRKVWRGSRKRWQNRTEPTNSVYSAGSEQTEKNQTRNSMMMMMIADDDADDDDIAEDY